MPLNDTILEMQAMKLYFTLAGCLIAIVSIGMAIVVIVQARRKLK